jgi:hypothetical protein
MDVPDSARTRRRFAASMTLLGVIACSDHVEPADPLYEMLVAECERRTRCNCASTSSDCETYARSRAAELRDHAARSGSDLFDHACADLGRAKAEATCVEGGIAYAPADAAVAAGAERCARFLFHGDRPVGAPCEVPSKLPSFSPSNCEVDAVCLDLQDDGPRCSPWPPSQLGDLCQDGDIAGVCPPDLACVPIGDGKRQCQRFTEIDEPCVGAAGDYCEGPPGQRCDPETSTCRALPGPGEACALSVGSARERCAGGLYCDARCNYDAYCEDEICRGRAGPAERCTHTESCALGLRCTEGTCAGYEACF